MLENYNEFCQEAYLRKCTVHTVARKRDEVSYGCYTSLTLGQRMRRGFALDKWAFHDVGKVCDDTENVCLAELVQTLSS